MHPILSEQIARARRQELLAAAARSRRAGGRRHAGARAAGWAVPARMRAGAGTLLIRAGARLAGPHAATSTALRLHNAA